MNFPWLTVLGLLPIIGSLLAFFLKGRTGKMAGMVVALATLAVAIATATQFSLGKAGFQLAENLPWIPQIGARYALGLDGMGLLMVLLTAFLVPLVMLAEWNHADDVRVVAAEHTGGSHVAVRETGRWGGNTFFGLALLLEGLSMYVFLATDVLLFYLVFEATLIPMFFMVGGFGGARRMRAAIKFLIYSLAGGLILLFGVVGVFYVSGAQGRMTGLITELGDYDFSGNAGKVIMLAFLIAFMIKAPMVPLHTWLPDTAEEATPGTSALLVGILDKIGTFGMIRYCLGIFPEASRWVAPAMIILALVAVIYGALVALGQKNLLRLISYTSVSHFGLIVLGIYAFTTTSMDGSIFYMLNHGFSIAALFLVAGMLIKRRGSAQIADFGGIQSVAPYLATAFLVAGLSGLALPGMSSFVSEILVLAGTWTRHPVMAGIATFGMVLAALYILMTYQRTMTGPISEANTARFSVDLTGVERLVIAPLFIALLVLGFFPKPAIDASEHTATTTMSTVGVADVAPAAGKVEK